MFFRMSVFAQSFYALRGSLSQLQNVIKFKGFRSLYSKSSLGIDGYLQHQKLIRSRLINIEEKFRNKMNEYVEDGSKNIIFTEDLKNMVHIAEENDVDLIIKMLTRFNQQNKQLRFGNFIFGPVVMRMFHILNKPDEALECYSLPELDGFFNQIMSHHLLFDLLYENKKYNEILSTFELFKSKQIEGAKFPKNLVVLTFAACYKLNTKESLEFALKLWSNLIEVGHIPTRKSATFCAALAISQGEVETALEILSSVKNQNYTTVRNMKVVIFLKLGRTEDIIPLLKTVLNQDQIQTFNRNVLEAVRSEIQRAGSTDLENEFNQVFKYFEEQGHISELTLDEQLCSEISLPQYTAERQQFPNSRFNNSGRPYTSPRTQLRPGLHEMQ